MFSEEAEQARYREYIWAQLRHGPTTFRRIIQNYCDEYLQDERTDEEKRREARKFVDALYELKMERRIAITEDNHIYLVF